MEQPLLPNPDPSTSTDSPAPESAPPTSLAGLAIVIILAAMSLWANVEASEGFDIAIVNAARPGTLAARRFDLLFVSNGKASQIIQNASELVEHILYPNELYPRKPVRSVTLRLAGHNLSEVVTVSHSDDSRRPGDFLIHVCPSAMADANPGLALGSAVQRAMARIWLWDGRGASPKWLVDAMMEYLSSSAGFSDAVPLRSGGPCWGEEEEPVGAARFLKYLEESRSGFIARLNRAMMKHWNGIMVDVALGSSSERLCLAYQSRTGQQGAFSGSRSVVGLSQAV